MKINRKLFIFTCIFNGIAGGLLGFGGIFLSFLIHGFMGPPRPQEKQLGLTILAGYFAVLIIINLVSIFISNIWSRNGKNVYTVSFLKHFIVNILLLIVSVPIGFVVFMLVARVWI